MNKSSKGPNLLQSFFCFFAGVNRDILKKNPNEINRNTCVGAAVFIASVISALSIWNFAILICDNHKIDLLTGIIGGLIVSLIIRFLVQTTFLPGGSVNSKLVKVSVAIRVLLLMILGFLFSIPVFVQLYSNEINREIYIDNKNVIASNVELEQLRTNIDSLKKEIKEKDSIYDQQLRLVEYELRGNYNRGYGRIAKELHRNAEEYREHVVVPLRKEMAEQDSIFQVRYKESLVNLQNPSFSRKMEVLSKAVKDYTDIIPIIIILLLFCFTMISPVVFKLMECDAKNEKLAYDEIKDNLK